MASTPRPYNFSAGPAILAAPVFERAAEAVKELRMGGHARDGEGIGLSVLEVSHRGKPFTEVHEAAMELAREVLRIPDTHDVLFLQGGASLQFAMVPFNLRLEGKPCAYVDTGAWSQKAIKEAKVQTDDVKVIASSEATGFDRIPEFDPAEAAGASYLHLTTNNTVRGTEIQNIPDAPEDVPIVIDCSSHIGSRPLDFDRVGLGYAGAQKNLGSAGTTLVFIRKDLVERKPAAPVPVILRYRTHTAKDSLFNTPNTFGTLVLKLNLEWMKEQGGIDVFAERNAKKAGLLYGAIDESSLFTGHAQHDSRSHMNVTFTLGGAPEADREALTKRFLAEAKAAGLDGLKGHRSVGGLRASIYNAFPIEGVQALVEFMADFERNA